MGYKCFLSSKYRSLEKERNEALGAIADLGNESVAMEHFVVQSNERNFSDISMLIDKSDVLILLLGPEFGYVPDKTTGKSMTQMEYEYALKKKKKICAIKLPSYLELKKRYDGDRAALTEEELRQVGFVESVQSPKEVEEDKGVYRIICQFNATMLELDKQKEEAAWKKECKKYDFSGKWYTVHTSAKDPGYLRVGTADIVQRFDKEHYRELNVNAKNYDVQIKRGTLQKDAKGNILMVDSGRETSWYADYELYIRTQQQIVGVYIARRPFESTFENEIDKPVERQYGVHEFLIDPNDVSVLKGTFRNAADPYKEEEASNHKAGEIRLYRKQKDRDAYVFKMIKDKKVVLKK